MSERVVQDEVSMSERVGQGVDMCEVGTGVTGWDQRRYI